MIQEQTFLDKYSLLAIFGIVAGAVVAFRVWWWLIKKRFYIADRRECYICYPRTGEEKESSAA